MSQPLKLGEGVRGPWPNLVHNCGGKHPACALGMLSLKKFMNCFPPPVLLCGSFPFRRMSAESHVLYLIICVVTVLLMPAALFLGRGWVCAAINPSSLRKGNPIKMEKASIWQTFRAPSQLSIQLNFSGTHGVVHFSLLFRGLPRGFWPVLHCI